MIYSKYSTRAVSLLVFLPMVLAAQRMQENVVPLKGWSNPLYWHANPAEKAAAAKPLPQLQFSTNAVSPDALTFVAITPCRLVDTRGGGFNGATPFNGPSIAGGATVTFPVQDPTEATTNTTPAPCGTIPSFAEAYSFNLTVVPVAGGVFNYVTLWPAAGTQPVVSTLNDVQGGIVANAAIVAAGTPSGGVSVYNEGPADIDVVIDMNGYFTAPTDLNGNTAIGAETLAANISGFGDTATGAGALAANTTGSLNMASGINALDNNTTGGNNTASGAQALLSNTSGGQNTANGVNALFSNTTGSDNTASGYQALLNNTSGGNNAATGFAALTYNTTGGDNTASGFQALFNNTVGGNNTASGFQALLHNTTGASNTAIGFGAGALAPSGNSNSIYIGNAGFDGDVAGTIKIGDPNTAVAFFVAGVHGVALSSTLPVVIDSNGQLGTGAALAAVRAPVQPDLVVTGKDGQSRTVPYEKITSTLLNEQQKQTEQIRSLEDRLAAIEAALQASLATGPPRR